MTKVSQIDNRNYCDVSESTIMDNDKENITDTLIQQNNYKIDAHFDFGKCSSDHQVGSPNFSNHNTLIGKMPSPELQNFGVYQIVNIFGTEQIVNSIKETVNNTKGRLKIDYGSMLHKNFRNEKSDCNYFESIFYNGEDFFTMDPGLNVRFHNFRNDQSDHNFFEKRLCSHNFRNEQSDHNFFEKCLRSRKFRNEQSDHNFFEKFLCSHNLRNEQSDHNFFVKFVMVEKTHMTMDSSGRDSGSSNSKSCKIGV